MQETLRFWPPYADYQKKTERTGWLYPLANLVHVLGAALVVGVIATFDIRVLRGLREAPIVSHTVIPISIAGFLLQAVSGLVLLSAQASRVGAQRQRDTARGSVPTPPP